MMHDWTSMYIAVNTNDNSEMGLVRLNDFSSNGDIAMYAYTTCTNMTLCGITSMVLSVSSTDYVYFASMTQDTYDDRTLANIHHLDSSGNYYWAVSVDQGVASLADLYYVQRMLSFSSGTKIAAISN